LKSSSPSLHQTCCHMGLGQSQSLIIITMIYGWGNQHPATPAILGYIYNIGTRVLTHNHTNFIICGVAQGQNPQVPGVKDKIKEIVGKTRAEPGGDLLRVPST
jgi:hypothetical protein